MTMEEQAFDFLANIKKVDINKKMLYYFEIAMILAHDDMIREECAEIAETIVSESLYDGAGYYQVDIPFMKAAIIGKDKA